jgi:hypothetical protein
MDSMERLVYASWVFRAVVMAVGLIVIFIGLYLHRRPDQARSAGSLNAEYHGGKLSLRGAAGTFFLVLGTVIMLAGLLRPSSFRWSRVSHAPDGSDASEEFYGAPMLAPPESVEAWRKSGRLDSASFIELDSHGESVGVVSAESLKARLKRR